MKNTESRLALLCVSTIFISLVFTALSFAKIDPKTVAGIWLFDEGSGNIAKDTSGNKNDGKLMGDPKWVNGKFGKALQFDSKVPNFVEIPDSDSLNVIKLTFSAWIRLVNPVGENVILMKQNAYFWVLGADQTVQSNLFLAGAWGAVPRYTAKTKIIVDTWTHIAYTYDGLKARFYLNGAFDGEVATPGGNVGVSTSALRIGERIDPTAGNSFDGVIDDIMIFNDVQSEADIKGLSSTAVEPAGKLTITWGELRE
jgi:hypothetical protein